MTEVAEFKRQITPFIKVRYIIVLFFLIVAILLITGGCSYVTHGIVSGASKIFPGCLYFVQTNEKLIALTMDDGPDSITTRQILSVLQHYDAKATFFLIGERVNGNEKLVSEIVEQGHEIGHHMLTGQTTIRLPDEEFRRQFDQAHQILSQYAEVRWFRPASGWYSGDMIDYLTESDYDYRCVLGSVYPFDVQIPSSVFATVFISVNIRPGSIVVLHDRGNSGRRTVKILKRIIPKLQNRGYQFVTLTELFQGVRKGMRSKNVSGEASSHKLAH